MQSGLGDMAKQQRTLRADALCKEARGEGLNLGRKISVPKDVMMEELNLPSNRGSRMFQERQKRVESFTLENTGNRTYYNNVHPEAIPPPQTIPWPHGGRENEALSSPGKHSLLFNLQKTVAKKGSPDVLAPGYSGPLNPSPHEKFNLTVIPKPYCSPWRDAPIDNGELLISLTAQLPQAPQRLQTANFNRTAVPFGGPMASKRVSPETGCEALKYQRLPINLNRTSRRPNFNRAPRGWGIDNCPESKEL